jgi:hypothetical protein
MSGCTYCHKGGGANGDHGFHVATALTTCTGCHSEVTGNNVGTITKDTTNYDGSAATNTVKGEVTAFGDTLLLALQEYCNQNGSANDIAYDPGNYPYFFIDTNGNGFVDGMEGNFSNAYDTWTARSLRAAHNYQMVQVDPGAWAHNHKYILQLLYDTIADLNGQTTSNWLTGLTRP